jgi:DNA-binding NtrC family response regulator
MQDPWWSGEVTTRTSGQLSTGKKWPDLASAVKRHTIVLVVDPDPGITDMVGKALRRAGDRAFSAHSVAEARLVLALAGNSIERVLVSLSQPDGEGLNLAREITEQFPAIRVIVTSGMAPPENLEFPMLLKPFSIESLWIAMAAPAERPQPALDS